MGSRDIAISPEMSTIVMEGHVGIFYACFSVKCVVGKCTFMMREFRFLVTGDVDVALCFHADTRESGDVLHVMEVNGNVMLVVRLGEVM